MAGKENYLSFYPHRKKSFYCVSLVVLFSEFFCWWKFQFLSNCLSYMLKKKEWKIPFFFVLTEKKNSSVSLAVFFFLKVLLKVSVFFFFYVSMCLQYEENGKENALLFILAGKVLPHFLCAYLCLSFDFLLEFFPSFVLLSYFATCLSHCILFLIFV